MLRTPRTDMLRTPRMDILKRLKTEILKCDAKVSKVKGQNVIKIYVLLS